MTKPYALRALAHPSVAPDAVATLTGFGAAAFVATTTAAAGQYRLAGFALLVVLGLLVALKRVDSRARRVEAPDKR
ncbi:hypothetical protein [Haloarcula amylovorans]|uniref:hypothetical protein n=1 Tax=Haloarcula amylovorans TaxID=2562280 RepID=UPI001075D851|nr:hypothetical protein [Halomicroarcula amylolytica]